MTPIMTAAQYGHKKIVEALIEKGANIHLENNICKLSLTMKGN